jgi:hypothetical protein
MNPPLLPLNPQLSCDRFTSAICPLTFGKDLCFYFSLSHTVPTRLVPFSLFLTPRVFVDSRKSTSSELSEIEDPRCDRLMPIVQFVTRFFQSQTNQPPTTLEGVKKDLRLCNGKLKLEQSLSDNRYRSTPPQDHNSSTA